MTNIYTWLGFTALFSIVHAGNYTVTDEAWFEFEVKDIDGPDQDYSGRITIALFGDTAPMTVLNFKSIVKGYKKGDEVLHYKNTTVHRIVKDFVIQMGDVTTGDGTGGKSIYGKHFDDEAFILSHLQKGWVAMANHGNNTNGSQFFILLSRARWLDGHHVVFGKVIKGFDTLTLLGELDSDRTTAQPKLKVTITNCGVNDLSQKYDLLPYQLEMTEDID